MSFRGRPTERNRPFDRAELSTLIGIPPIGLSSSVRRLPGFPNCVNRNGPLFYARCCIRWESASGAGKIASHHREICLLPCCSVETSAFEGGFRRSHMAEFARSPRERPFHHVAIVYRPVDAAGGRIRRRSGDRRPDGGNLRDNRRCVVPRGGTDGLSWRAGAGGSIWVTVVAGAGRASSVAGKRPDICMKFSRFECEESRHVRGFHRDDFPRAGRFCEGCEHPLRVDRSIGPVGSIASTTDLIAERIDHQFLLRF